MFPNHHHRNQIHAYVHTDIDGHGAARVFHRYANMKIYVVGYAHDYETSTSMAAVSSDSEARRLVACMDKARELYESGDKAFKFNGFGDFSWMEEFDLDDVKAIPPEVRNLISITPVSE